MRKISILKIYDEYDNYGDDYYNRYTFPAEYDWKEVTDEELKDVRKKMDCFHKHRYLIQSKEMPIDFRLMLIEKVEEVSLDEYFAAAEEVMKAEEEKQRKAAEARKTAAEKKKKAKEQTDRERKLQQLETLKQELGLE